MSNSNSPRISRKLGLAPFLSNFEETEEVEDVQEFEDAPPKEQKFRTVIHINGKYYRMGTPSYIRKVQSLSKNEMREILLDGIIILNLPTPTVK